MNWDAVKLNKKLAYIEDPGSRVWHENYTFNASNDD